MGRGPWQGTDCDGAARRPAVVPCSCRRGLHRKVREYLQLPVSAIRPRAGQKSPRLGGVPAHRCVCACECECVCVRRRRAVGPPLGCPVSLMATAQNSPYSVPSSQPSSSIRSIFFFRRRGSIEGKKKVYFARPRMPFYRPVTRLDFEGPVTFRSGDGAP